MLERLSEDRTKLRARTLQRVLQDCDDRFPDGVHEVIGDVLYHERRRMAGRPPVQESEADFFRSVARRAAGASPVVQKRVLKTLVQHYLNGIEGRFDPWVYGLATRILPAGLSLLADGLSPWSLLKLRETSRRLDQSLWVTGEVEAVRRLKDQGRVLVYVPSHVSNLDSAVIAYALYRVGLPPALYGAGRTVFELPVFGPFMNQLGAYRIDLERRSDLYRTVVKEFATTTLVHGYDNLFFPGGRRSRSGAVEDRLKKGLLGTALSASQWNMDEGRSRPWVYVVPVALTCELVLEAETLVADHLSATGGGRVIIPEDDSSRPDRVLGFMRRMFGLQSRIVVRFMPPLDPFGHPVDRDGFSVDPGTGRVVEPDGYLERDGLRVGDRQRDRVFTERLADSVTGSLHRGMELFPTHLVARAAFGALCKRHNSGDLYGYLATEGKGTVLSRTRLNRRTGELKKAAMAMAAEGNIHLSRKVAAARPADIVNQALESFGTSDGVPALQANGGGVFSRNPNLLFYYRNRLNGFGFDGEPDVLEEGLTG